MKNLVLACALLVCSGGAAFANSDAYPEFSGSAGAAVAAMSPSGAVASTNANAYPDFAATPATTVVAGGVLPPLGGQGEPESANSLPAGFERGTAPYQAAQMVARYLQGQANQQTHKKMVER